ncbi:putative zinc-binding oxidoreductase [Lachnellula suecica]|uniref:Putative zinc-binding oxidoreductase n=1 Tax=Lachnellula suecica TaxID=602035 RepID=A0A8T9BQ76_9HELO|nr:putative zinc-binding oxidoreductase [Lachnellula suecica]
METMRAINLSKTGSAKYDTTALVTDLTLNSSQPRPVPSSSDVLVRIHAVAITPYELTWPAPALADPRIPCHDIAGIVVSASPTSSFRAGDKVFGLKDFRTQGGMAEYALADPAHLAIIPEGLDFVQAASIPRAALTAWQALRVQRGGVLKVGMSLLVTGASGAVGRMGVQIGKKIVGEKGKVVAVGGVGTEDIGADVAFNYRKTANWVGGGEEGGVG